MTTQHTRVLHGNTLLHVCYTNDPAAVNDWLDEHCPADTDTPVPTTSYHLLGLDVEWKPVFTKAWEGAAFPQMALMQLSTAWGEVLLYHVHHAPAELPESLRRVLVDTRVLKVGLGILDDVMKIHSKWRVKPRAYLDLHTLYQQQAKLAVGSMPPGPERPSLLGYAQHYLDNCRNWKTKKITLSNWEQWPLSPRQRAYAAMDAYVGAAVFVQMGIFEQTIQAVVC
jgi:ribonuclease D